jgi:membrane protein
VATENETSSLAAQLAELSNRPVDDTRIGRARAQAIALAHRATTWGPFEPVAEVGWRAQRRDASIGGSVLGAALAYRIFIWLLPFVLVLILGLALAAGQSQVSVAELVDDAGVTGFIASSVAEAAEGTRGWAVVSALVVTVFVLLYQSSALLRSIRAVTALAWRLPVSRVPSPARSTLVFLAWLIGFVAVGSSAAPIRRALEFPLDVVADLVVYGAGLPLLWLTLSWFLLPHGAARWTELVPGALLVGFGIGAIGLFNSLVLFPWLVEREETYGVLGIAAGLLFGFFLIGRTIELAAALNATLAEERRRTLAR